MHLGNARTALVAWLSVRSQGGTSVWRVEDLDPQRSVPGRAREQARDLAWLGLDWDEGPWAENDWEDEPAGDAAAELRRDGASGTVDPAEQDWWQSCRGAHYEAALRRLQEQGLVFPCRLSRRELAQVASAPHGSVAGACGAGVRATRYPASARPRLSDLAPGWFEDVLAGRDSESSVRLRVDPGDVQFRDLLYGEQHEDPAQTCGDFVLRRRDGVWAYHLAVVVDDAAMGINEVVRGADLLDSTGQHLVLQRALGLPAPAYGHVPLLLNERGEKLNKRDGALEVAALRRAGVDPRRVVGYLAHTLDLAGSAEAEASPAELISEFTWSRLRREPVRVPSNLAELLAGNRADPPGARPNS